MKVLPTLIDSVENLNSFVVPNSMVAKTSEVSKIGNGSEPFEALPNLLTSKNIDNKSIVMNSMGQLMSRTIPFDDGIDACYYNNTDGSTGCIKRFTHNAYNRDCMNFNYKSITKFTLNTDCFHIEDDIYLVCDKPGFYSINGQFSSKCPNTSYSIHSLQQNGISLFKPDGGVSSTQDIHDTLYIIMCSLYFLDGTHYQYNGMSDILYIEKGQKLSCIVNRYTKTSAYPAPALYHVNLHIVKLPVTPLLDKGRKSLIGSKVMFGSSKLPEGFMGADGSLASFEDGPELKEMYDSGAFEGYVLDSSATDEEKAEFPDKGVLTPDATGLYLPRSSGTFPNLVLAVYLGSK